MNAKKILVSLLAVLLILTSVTACGNQNKTNNEVEETTDAPVDTTPVEIEDEGVDFWLENNAGFENAVEGTAEDFEIEIANGAVTILSYKGTQEHLIIPSEINGLPVVGIADGAFAIVEEEDAETVDENTEEKPIPIQLKTLIIPNSVTAIGTGILAGCETLHSLQTPLMGESEEGTQYLGYLFGADTHENNARDIPVSLKCLRLTADWQTLPAYSLFDCNDIICLSLPENVTVIEKYAIYNGASLRQIDGIEKVVTFGDRALMNCSSLQILNLGDALESVGFGAFEGCKSIRTMNLPFVGGSKTENTYLAYVFGAAQPDFAQGFYPSNLQKITLSSACQTLGNYALFECESLKEITLPEGMTAVGVRAFYGCVSLWSIKIPNSVTTIREEAFSGCDALVTIEFGQGLTSIGINAFYNCDSLKEVALPATLKSLPASCFAGCIALEALDLGGVTQVGAEAFRHCKALTSVTASGQVDFEKGNEYVTSILHSK